MEKTIAAIILAAGKGTRINLPNINKVAYIFRGKPIIRYGIDLLNPLVSKTVVVVGSHAQSVKDSLMGYDVVYAVQHEQLGTGHAVKVGMELLYDFKPSNILVGYGDHMMHYQQSSIKAMLDMHVNSKSALTLVVSKYNEIEKLGYGRIVRNKDGNIVSIVEQNDADEKTRQIKEFNAGLYCFQSEFLKKYISRIVPSPVSKEYYLTDLVRLAIDAGEKVLPFYLPYHEVGIGINSRQDLEKSSKIHNI
ncbi:MAG: sugar phosphate nucleotidyltransferase [Patescibacteria group bacterium]